MGRITLTDEQKRIADGIRTGQGAGAQQAPSDYRGGRIRLDQKQIQIATKYGLPNPDYQADGAQEEDPLHKQYRAFMAYQNALREQQLAMKDRAASGTKKEQNGALFIPDGTLTEQEYGRSPAMQQQYGAYENFLRAVSDRYKAEHPKQTGAADTKAQKGRLGPRSGKGLEEGQQERGKVSEQEFNRSAAMVAQYGSYRNYLRGVYAGYDEATAAGTKRRAEAALAEGKVSEAEFSRAPAMVERYGTYRNYLNGVRKSDDEVKRGRAAKRIESLGIADTLERYYNTEGEEQAQLRKQLADKGVTGQELNEWRNTVFNNAGRFIGDLAAGFFRGGLLQNMSGMEGAMAGLENAANGTAAWALDDLANLLPNGKVKTGLKSSAERLANAGSRHEENARQLQEQNAQVMQQLTQEHSPAAKWVIEQMPSAGNMLLNVGTAGMAGVPNLAALGTTAGGNAYMEAKNDGATNEQALAYGIANGALEVLSEKLFGGNPLYDTDAGLVNRLAGKLTDNKTVMRILNSKGFDLLSEGLEEVVTEITEPWAQALIYAGKDAEFATWESAANAFAGGVFLSVVGNLVDLPASMRKREIQRTINDVTERVLYQAEQVEDAGVQQAVADVREKMEYGEDVTAEDLGNVLNAMSEADAEVDAKTVEAETAQAQEQAKAEANERTYQIYKGAIETAQEAARAAQEYARAEQEQRQEADATAQQRSGEMRAAQRAQRAAEQAQYDQGSLLSQIPGTEEIGELDPEQYARQQTADAEQALDEAALRQEEAYLTQRAQQAGYDEQTAAYFLNGNTTGLPAERYAASFERVYEQGRLGASKQRAMRFAEGMNQDVAAAAYQAGLAAGQKGDTNGSRETAGNRQVGQARQRAEGAADGVRGSAAQQQRADAGRKRAEGARALAKTWDEVTVAALGLGESETGTVRVMPEGGENASEDIKRAAKHLKAAGVKNVKIFAGQLTQNVNGQTLYADAAVMQDGTVLIRADSAEYSAFELAKHESYHILAKQNPEMAARIRTRLLAEGKITREMIESYVDAYARAYGDDMDAYVEEIVADAYAGMNRTDYGTNQLRTDVQMDVGQWKKKTGSARAPPAKSRYSIGKITDEDGRDYGRGVHLDSTLLENLTDSERIQMVKERVKELGGQHFTAYDSNGNEVDIQIAKPNARFANKSGKNVQVNKDLTTKNRNSKVKQEAVVLADELITTANHKGDSAARYPHGWLDNDGKNDWAEWETYIQDKENIVWVATLHVATSANGEKILYDIDPIKKAGQSGNSDTSTATPIVAGKTPTVKRKYSAATAADQRKAAQFDLIQNSNAAEDDYHTWIRSADEIRTLAETLADPEWAEYDEYDPDYTRQMAENAVKNGKVTVYSSYPIGNGVFVTPSRMEARSYSANGKVYSKTVNVDDVAWIDPTQGQYAAVRDSGIGTFDKTNPDIQFSASAEQVQTEQETQQEDEKKKGRYRDLMGEKPAKYVRGLESRMVNELAENLSVPAQARREVLQPIAEDALRTFFTDGQLDRAKLDELFETAYQAGVEEEVEFWEQYGDLKKFIRDQKISISETDRADIADFDLFRKAAFGTLTISKDGLPVDVAYQQLQEMAPELFPAEITAPGDQLMQIYDVAKSIHKVQKSLDEYYGPRAKAFKDWQRANFTESIDRLTSGLRIAQRYLDAQEKAKEKLAIPQTEEETRQMWEQLKDARRAVEKAQGKTLLTEADQKVVNRLLRGETSPGYAAKLENGAQILRVYEAKAEYDMLALKLKAWNVQRRNALRDFAEQALTEAEAAKWVDKTAGILYSRETMERNIRDIARKGKISDEKANAFINKYFWPVHENESKRKNYIVAAQEKIRALKLDRQVRKGNMVSESYAVQWLGEAEFNREYLKQHPRTERRGGMTFEEWNAAIQEFEKQNPDMDLERVRAAVRTFHEVYDQLFQDMNRVRIENGYEPVNYLQGYFPHFQEGEEGGNILQKFARAAGIEGDVTLLPATINGLTAKFRPGIRYMANVQQRLGYATAYDALQGFDRYIEVASDVIYHTADIQRMRALATQIRWRASDEGLQARIDAIRTNPFLNPDEANEQIANLTKDGRYALSNFVDELDEYTNLLAGKKSRLDRGMEKLVGRRFYNVMKKFESRVGANMVAANVGSALTNFIPITQAWSQVSTTDVLRGMWDTLKNYKQADGLDAASSFINNRSGYGRLATSTMDKVSAAAGILMEGIDGFTTGSVVRARYYQNLRRGMSEANAMQEADQFAAGVMADRSKGSTPTLYSARNPLVKLFTQFQLEVNNELSWIFKDMVQEERKKGVAALAKAMFKFLIGAWIYNEFYEAVVGRRAALDPLDIINDTVGDFTGYQMPNTVQSLARGEWDFEKEKPGTYQSIKNLEGNLLSELPGTQALTLLGVDEALGIEIDGGRIAVASAIPNLGKIEKALLASSEDMDPAKKAKTITDELIKPGMYVATPFGGGQLRKLYQGGMAAAAGGSYTVDNEGNDILQYPVYNDNAADRAKSWAQALLFGKTATEEAQKWVESGFKSLSAKETAAYQAMTQGGVSQRESFTFVNAMKKVQETEARLATLFAYDIQQNAKTAYYYAVMAQDTERERMDTLSENGVGYDAYMQYKQAYFKAFGTQSASQERVQTILDGMNLTKTQKAAIWVAMGKDWKEENNPYK